MPTAIAWTAITDAHLSAARPASLVEAVRTKTRAPGEADPIPGLIADVVNEIRGCIGFRSSALLSATAGTVPPNLVDFTVQKICRVMKGKLSMPYNEAERDEERTYQSRLGSLRDGNWPIDLPLDPETPTAQGTIPGPSIRRNHRRFDHRDEDGA